MLQNKSGITAQGMGASHLSRGMAVPALAAVEGSALTPGNTLNAVSESSMIYSMPPPPSAALGRPSLTPAGVAVGPRSSLILAGWTVYKCL